MSTDVGVPPGRFDWNVALPTVGDLGIVHLVAVGGAGMSAVARLLVAHGLSVSGSDASDGPMVTSLRTEGVRVWVGHDAAHLAGVDTVVVSTAIREDNIELVEARRRGLRVLHRAQALAVAMSGHRRVAIAGANGKTTTTAMLATALRHLGADPAFAIGGELVDAGTNAHLGRGEVAVIEADESDGSFVVYAPHVAVVTSVQPDHLDYYGTFAAVEAGYRAFVASIVSGGLLIVCLDDPGAAALGQWASARGQRVVGYGQAPTSSTRVTELTTAGTTAGAVLVDPAGARHDLRLRVPGWFNVLNATAAYTAAVDGLHLGAEPVLAGLAAFRGTRRRFERKGVVDGVLVVDDYAHNPAKVGAVVDAARGVVGPGGRLVVCFQPHLYSRTRDFAPQFASALSGADVVVVMDVYGSREDPVEGVTGRLVSDRIDPAVEVSYVADKDAVASVLARLLRPGDVLVTVGAGDVTSVGPQVLAGRAASHSHSHSQVEGEV